MPLSKQKKQEVLKDSMDIFSQSESAVFVNFRKLPVAETTAMRRELRQKGVKYRVAKKTLVHRALREQNFTGELPTLEGELAVVYGDDALAPAREIHPFVRKYKDALSILGGIFQGVYKSKEEMTAIATIPPIEVLRGMFVNLINSPIQRFVTVTSKIAEMKGS